MSIRKIASAALLAAMLGLTACNGAATVTAGTALQGQGPNMAARSAFLVIEGDAQVKALGELQMYRVNFDDAAKQWVVYYFSPSKVESYRCVVGADNKVTVAKLMDPIQAYKPDYQIDRTKWKIDSEQAKTIAVQHATTINVNVAVNGFTSARLISPMECKEQTGKDVTDPVWVLVANNINVYINANTGAQVQTGVPTPAPSILPSSLPTVLPSAVPSITATTVPSAAPTAVATLMPMPSPGAEVSLKATLTGASEVPPVTSSWSGQVACKLNAGRTAVQIDGTFTTSAGGTVSGAHIHRGAVGANGPIVYNLAVTGTTLQGTWTTGAAEMELTPDLVEALMRGELYVNVHSSANPNGEIRGQLTMAP